MRLYLFDHCYLCFRVRMIAALKRLHLQEIVVLDDDTETMVSLVGKRQVPIFIRDDGKPMLESDGLGASVLTGPERTEIAAWEKATAPKAAPLTQPRYLLLGLPQFGTAAALDHYTMRKRRTLGDLVELRAKTRELMRELTPSLEELDRMIESPQAMNGALSLDDVRVLPMLRSSAVVKGLRFPDNVRRYYETMMDNLGYQPLPAI